MLDLVENPEDRFSHDTAHMVSLLLESGARLNIGMQGENEASLK